MSVCVCVCVCVCALVLGEPARNPRQVRLLPMELNPKVLLGERPQILFCQVNTKAFWNIRL